LGLLKVIHKRFYVSAVLVQIRHLTKHVVQSFIFAIQKGLSYIRVGGIHHL